MRKPLITILLLLLTSAAADAAPPTVPWSAMVALDTVSAAPGDHVAVPIRLINNDALCSGIYVPLRLESPHLTVDSVSFAGSIMTSDFTGMVNLATAGTDEIEVTLAPNLVSPIPTIPAIDGLIATLWVTVSGSAPYGLARIDSIAIDSLITDGGPGARVWKFVHGSDELGETMTPSFTAGGVIVESPTGVEDDESDMLPSAFELAQNYPNPFNPSTTIEFALPTAGEVQLVVYNVLGQEIATLVQGTLPAGTHRVTFDASGRPSGVYFYRLSHEAGVETRKMTLIK